MDASVRYSFCRRLGIAIRLRTRVQTDVPLQKHVLSAELDRPSTWFNHPGNKIANACGPQILTHQSSPDNIGRSGTTDEITK